MKEIERNIKRTILFIVCLFNLFVLLPKDLGRGYIMKTKFL